MNKNSFTGAITVLEFHDGKLHREWDGPEECAKAYHVHPSVIKELICNGTPLPSSASPCITFDLDPESPFDIEISPTATKHKRYRFKKSN